MRTLTSIVSYEKTGSPDGWAGLELSLPFPPVLLSHRFLCEPLEWGANASLLPSLFALP